VNDELSHDVESRLQVDEGPAAAAEHHGECAILGPKGHPGDRAIAVRQLRFCRFLRQSQGSPIVHRRSVDDDETVMCLRHDSPLTEQDIDDFRFRWQAEEQYLDLRGQLGRIGRSRRAMRNNRLHGLRTHIEHRERNSRFGELRCHPPAHATQTDETDGILTHELCFLIRQPGGVYPSMLPSLSNRTQNRKFAACVSGSTNKARSYGGRRSSRLLG